MCAFHHNLSAHHSPVLSDSVYVAFIGDYRSEVYRRFEEQKPAIQPEQLALFTLCMTASRSMQAAAATIACACVGWWWCLEGSTEQECAAPCPHETRYAVAFVIRHPTVCSDTVCREPEAAGGEGGRGVCVGGALEGEPLQNARCVKSLAKGMQGWPNERGGHSGNTPHQHQHPQDTAKVLTVTRPPDAASLPGVVGLPAGYVLPSESHEQAVRARGMEKLGVALTATRFVGRGRVQRAAYVLHMEEFEAELDDPRDTPQVPQPHAQGTQYAAWQWGDAASLAPAARQGSLCSQIYLATHGGTEGHSIG